MGNESETSASGTRSSGAAETGFSPKDPIEVTAAEGSVVNDGTSTLSGGLSEEEREGATTTADE